MNVKNRVGKFAFLFVEQQLFQPGNIIFNVPLGRILGKYSRRR